MNPYLISRGRIPLRETGEPDGTEGAGGTETLPEGETPPEGEGKTFTEAQVNEIVKNRLKRDKGLKPEDLGFKTKAELEAALAKAAKLEEDAKSDEERKIEEARAAGRTEAETEILGKANARLVKSEFVATAKDLNVVDPTALYLIAKGEGLLDGLSVTDADEVDGMDDEFWEGLLKDRDYLIRAGSEEGGTNEEQQQRRTPGNANAGGGRKPPVKLPEKRQQELKGMYPALARQR